MPLLERVQALVSSGKILISSHGYEELSSDDILVDDAIFGIYSGQVIEEYPDYHKGPCMLVLQKDAHGKPVHIVWGIPKSRSEPAVIVTGYRPDPALWNYDFSRRQS
jgi:hypothetical protein